MLDAGNRFNEVPTQRKAKQKMLTTLKAHEVRVPKSMRDQDERYWPFALLPLDEGTLLVDVEIAIGKTPCLQRVIFPATLSGIASLELHDMRPVAVVYLPPPNSDGDSRQAISVDTIDCGCDTQNGFRRVLLIRDLQQTWHVCGSSTDTANIEERNTLMNIGPTTT